MHECIFVDSGLDLDSGLILLPAAAGCGIVPFLRVACLVHCCGEPVVFFLCIAVSVSLVSAGSAVAVFFCVLCVVWCFVWPVYLPVCGLELQTRVCLVVYSTYTCSLKLPSAVFREVSDMRVFAFFYVRFRMVSVFN